MNVINDVLATILTASPLNLALLVALLAIAAVLAAIHLAAQRGGRR